MSKKQPGHVTARGTQKYQANGPSEWAPFFVEIAESIGGKGAPMGLGIRAVLAAAFDGHTAKQLAKASAGISTTSALVSKAPAKKIKGADVKAAAKAAAAAKEGK